MSSSCIFCIFKHRISGFYMSKKIAFGWYGGKFSHLDWLLPLLPQSLHYCEPFGGSAAVILNRTPSPIETFNDLDRDIIIFFKVLREHKDELIEKIGLTPFSREEFEISSSDEKDLDDIERARRFFIRARQVRTGLAQKASGGRWAHCLLTSRAGMSGAVSRWLGSVEGLSEIAQRLLRIQIEHRPALEVIERYDSEETLFYCDPPYPHESRSDSNAYKYEMKDDEHRELARVLNAVKGKVAISGYECDLMSELYGGWNVHYSKKKKINSSKAEKREVLWTNYIPDHNENLLTFI